MLNLDSIRALYRQPDTLALWGIPYDMRSGQSPRDLWNAPRPDVLARAGGRLGAMMHAPGPLDDWIYLGCPGWWGSIEEVDQKRITVWLARHAELVPENPCEWSRVRRYHAFFEVIDRHMANYGEKIQLKDRCDQLSQYVNWRHVSVVLTDDAGCLDALTCAAIGQVTGLPKSDAFYLRQHVSQAWRRRARVMK